MSRSDPPRSPIVERLRQNSAPAGFSPARGRTLRRRLGIRFAALMRWLHIYLSMFGLAAILFFAVTGLTLNHPDWVFGSAERTTQGEGRMALRWLRLETPAPAEGEQRDLSHQVAKLEVVEHLRKSHGIRGALADFKTDERECVVTFKGPGYDADAFIDRESGQYSVTQMYHGALAVVNDLHKGRDTGKAWSVVIDVSAVLMTIIALSGLVLLFYLKLRRIPGLAVALIGTLVVVAIFLLGVP